MTPSQKSVSELMRSGSEIQKAMRQAVQQALRDGNVVWLPPQEIPLDEDNANGVGKPDGAEPSP